MKQAVLETNFWAQLRLTLTREPLRQSQRPFKATVPYCCVIIHVVHGIVVKYSWCCFWHGYYIVQIVQQVVVPCSNMQLLNLLQKRCIITGFPAHQRNQGKLFYFFSSQGKVREFEKNASSHRILIGLLVHHVCPQKQVIRVVGCNMCITRLWKIGCQIPIIIIMEFWDFIREKSGYFVFLKCWEPWISIISQFLQCFIWFLNINHSLNHLYMHVF